MKTFLGFVKVGKGTFAIQFFDTDKLYINSYFVQFSFKDPWWIPHTEHFYNKETNIHGWLFFYFGKMVVFSDQNIEEVKDFRFNRYGERI